MAESTNVTVPAPTFGSETARSAQFLIDAAWKVRHGYTVGGSTVEAGVGRLLEDVARQIDPEARTIYDGHAPHPTRRDATAHIVDLTFEERKALPGVYHRPVFDDYGLPAGWRCAVCWDDETAQTTSWPCGPATAGGADLANVLGLEHTR